MTGYMRTTIGTCAPQTYSTYTKIEICTPYDRLHENDNRNMYSADRLHVHSNKDMCSSKRLHLHINRKMFSFDICTCITIETYAPYKKQLLLFQVFIVFFVYIYILTFILGTYIPHSSFTDKQIRQLRKMEYYLDSGIWH